MPVAFRYDEGGEYLEVTLSGAFTLHEATDAIGVIVNSGEWLPSVNVLWDSRTATIDHIDQVFLEGLARFRSNVDLLRQDARAAVLVSVQAERVSAELARLFAGSYLTGEIRVFQKRDAAISWLTLGRRSKPESLADHGDGRSIIV